MKVFYHIFLLGAISLTIASCYKDNGNYVYDELEEITVSGIESSYTKISTVERLVADPQVASSDPDASFSYFWGIYETNVQGSVPKLDTIARTKALDYLVVQPAKTWVLVFGAKNEHTGVTKLISSTVNVVTQFTRGWYVLKDDGANSDLDQFTTPTGIMPDPMTPFENVYSSVNNKKIAGVAGMLSFCTNYKSDIVKQGTFANTRALFILGGGEGAVVDISSLKDIRSYANWFYVAPSVKAPSFVGEAAQANYLINDGKLHSIYNMSLNTGQFGGVIMRNDYNVPYRLSKYALKWSSGNPFFYDEMSTSFVSATGSATVMPVVGAASGSEMSPVNTNKDLLFLGIKTRSTYSGYAVFQDKTDPSLKMLSYIVPSGYNLNINNDTLDVTSRLYSAEKYCLNYMDEGLLYFSVGNEIWSRNLVNGSEIRQFVAPGDEKIEFISHRVYTSEATYAFNYIIVGTSSGGRYKVRMFSKSSGNLSAEPEFILEGQGRASDVIYMSPNVSGTTYQNQ